MIYNLRDRTIKLCDKKFHSENIDFIKTLLTENGYPSSAIDKHTRKRVTILNNTDGCKILLH